MTNSLEIFKTADGFHSLRNIELDETYHSRHGAMLEARHIFIENGYQPTLEGKSSIRVFEMGFGTGLNALLTLLNTPKEINLTYHTIEAYPLPIENVLALNHVELIKGDLAHYFFDEIHGLPWNEQFTMLSGMNFCKYCLKLEDFHPSNKYDLIYFDAFGPRAQPDLWSKTILQKMYDMLEVGGVLVTYCAKGEVRRTLKQIGFEVENLPGPPGKREMTRAFRNSQ